MDKTMKKYLENFVVLCYSRLEQGERARRGAYKKIDLYEQIIEELADVANYAFLEYMRMQNLKIAKSSLKTKKKRTTLSKKKRKKR